MSKENRDTVVSLTTTAVNFDRPIRWAFRGGSDMDRARIRVKSPRGPAAVALAGLLGLMPPAVLAQADARAPRPAAAPRGLWKASGRVTDQDGRPLAGVEVSASCGYGSLHRTGAATTGADGRYELTFGPGIVSVPGGAAPLQAATIAAHKPGHFEENLNRQGNYLAAQSMPGEDELKSWAAGKDRLILPERPAELNFVLRPAGRVAGTLVGERGEPLGGCSVSLTGAELPPSCSVMASARADEQGRFALEDIPTTYRFQFEVRKLPSRPPWHDSWASAALQFQRPEGGDLRARFGQREIRLRRFVLRVAGAGVHGREATPAAGNAGVLELAADDPSDVLERSDRLLSARSAVLTLRNPPGPGRGRSLIPDSVPAPPAVKSRIRLSRTRPDDAGRFTVSFENPRGVDLAPGKHQVIFQLMVGPLRGPVRERVLRQLDVRDGRYEVPVKVAPEWIDDSHVSITFVSVQPDHDAWVRSFFQEGRGTSYSGLWIGDGGPLRAIPFEADRGR